MAEFKFVEEQPQGFAFVDEDSQVEGPVSGFSFVEEEDNRTLGEKVGDSIENTALSALADTASFGNGFLKFGEGVTQSIYQLGEYVGILDEGSAQRVTDHYNQRQKTFDDEIATLLGGRDNPAYATASAVGFAGEAAPLFAVPMASTAVTVSGKVAQQAAVGGLVGHAMYQEDLDDKASSAGVTAALSAVFPVLGALGGKVLSKMRAKKFEKVAERARVLIGELDILPTVALRRAMMEMQPSMATIEQAALKGKSWNLSKEAVQETMERKILSEGTYLGRLKSTLGEVGKATRLGIDQVTSPIASRLERMGLPHISNALRFHDMDTAILIQKRLDVKDKFRNALKNVPDTTKLSLKRAILNGDKDAVDTALARLPKKMAMEVSESLSKVRSLLDDMYDEAVSQGIKVGKLQEFFPREIKDFKKFARKNGIPPTRVSNSLAEAINKKHKLVGEERFTARDVDSRNIYDYLTDEEIAATLARNVFKGKTENTVSSATQHIRGRTREKLDLKDMEDYAELDDSLTSYILGMTNKIQTRKFFGGKDLEKFKTIKEDQKVGAAVNSFVEDLVKNKKILMDDVAEVENMLTARFVDGSRSPSKFIQGLKNTIYTSTLGNPLAAMTQLGDLGASAYLNGLARALVNLPRALRSAIPSKLGGRAAPITVEDMGLNPLAHELEHLGTTAKLLHWSLKRSGFTAVDRIGKETILNSTLSKLGAMAKSAKGRVKLAEKYKDTYTPKEMRKFINDLASGNKESREVKMALWSELAKVQPISLAEMPEMYLRHPNGRIFYMLKTFTLKQLDLLRREAYDEIRKGNVVKGTSNLLRLGAIIGVANGGVEQAKSFITGEDVDFEDAFFANILRNYALSEYSLQLLKQGRPVEAVVRMMIPPVRVVEDPIRDLVEGFENMRTLKDLPPYGKVMHYLFVDQE